MNDVGRLELRIQLTDGSERTYSYSLHGEANSWLQPTDRTGNLRPPPLTIPETNLFDRELDSRVVPGQVLQFATSSDFVDISSSDPPIFESVIVPGLGTAWNTPAMWSRIALTVPALALDVVTAPIQVLFILLPYWRA